VNNQIVKIFNEVMRKKVAPELNVDHKPSAESLSLGATSQCSPNKVTLYSSMERGSSLEKGLHGKALQTPRDSFYTHKGSQLTLSHGGCFKDPSKNH